MEKVKQRRGKGNKQRNNVKPTITTSAAAQTQEPQQTQTTNWKSRAMVLVLTCLYIPLVAIFNPSTIPSLYRQWTYTPCQGVCSIDYSSACQADATQLVWMRIAKTGTTTVLDVMERGFQRKNVKRVDLRELEDVVSSIPDYSSGVVDRMGYHNPENYQERVKEYYRKASVALLYPPYRAQDRTLYEGHFVYFDFQHKAKRLVGPEPFYYQYLPAWIRKHYHLDATPLDVQYVTFLRNPQDRLKSMYYYDRHDARTTTWRTQFVGLFGNRTFQECLLDDECISKNQLRKWCSVQVESLCGVGKKCRPVTRESLQMAKQHLQDNKFCVVGITERMPESLELMQRVLPTYMEGIDLSHVPQSKSSRHIGRRESEFSPQAQAVLDDLCSLDQELYDYANDLLTERIQTCV